MGAKSGPCTHCGITATPLWRRGPPEKPILCNACGSRWRHRGTLAGYMPMQVTGLSTCHVPSGYVAPEEPVNPQVKSPESLKRKERSEAQEAGVAVRLRERKEKDGYETDGSEASLSGQAARRRKSPSCSPNSVLPTPRVRNPSSRLNRTWDKMGALLSDLNTFDLDLPDMLTSAEPFGGLADDATLCGPKERLAGQLAKCLDAGQYISGLVVRTKVEALGGPKGRKIGYSSGSNEDPKPSMLNEEVVEAKEQSGALPLLPSSACFTLPSRQTPSPSKPPPSWPKAAPGLAQLDITKLQGSDFGNGSPHRASFSDNLFFKGTAPAAESLNDFMARTRGEKRLGELAGVPGSFESLESGASLVLDETCEHPMVDLNPPPQGEPLLGADKGEKDLKELHHMFSAPIWDSLDMGGEDKGFQFGKFSAPVGL